MYKVIFKVIDINDSETITKMQAQINQWLTIKKLKKYKMSPVGDKLFFELCVKKEA